MAFWIILSFKKKKKEETCVLCIVELVLQVQLMSVSHDDAAAHPWAELKLASTNDERKNDHLGSENSVFTLKNRCN